MGKVVEHKSHWCSIPPDTVGNVPSSSMERRRRRAPTSGSGVVGSSAAECLLLSIDRLLLFIDCLVLLIDCWLQLKSFSFSSRFPGDEATIHFAWYQNTDKRDKEMLLVITTPKAKIDKYQQISLHTHSPGNSPPV